MIKTLIDRLVATYPTELAAFVDMVKLAAPVILIALAVWQVANACEWLIEWNERRCIERAKRLRYRTASRRQMERDMQQLWGRR